MNSFKQLLAEGKTAFLRQCGQFIKWQSILAKGTVSPMASLLLGSAVATAFMLATQSSASAQAAYGSYVGVGASVGVTTGPSDDRDVSGVVAARYKFLKLPISARAQVFIGDDLAVVPTVSYDIPLNWQTDAYIGAGVSIPTGSTPVGSETSFVIQPGVDYALPNSNLVVFGNAIIAFDGYEDGGTAASVQGGVGLRF